MNTSTNKIAVIGMSCRFPGAANVEEYWNNLINGRESLDHFSDEEIARIEPYFDKVKNNPDYVRVRGAIKDADKFDAHFFGMTPKEASEMDPQQRIWLETVWDAFEHAACDPFTYQGAIGVFAGGAMSSYLLGNILSDPKRMAKYMSPGFADNTQLTLSNDTSFIATRAAYHFNLKGPAIYVHTACSSSLVAITQACQSLYSFESDVCLAGGVRIYVPQEKGYLYQEGGISSPDGHCRPFDEKAEGTVGSNGVGVVVLKRLEDAIRDNDTIYALVSGWALNNDGSNKVSFTAPSIDGQAEVIMMAQAFAEVNPDEIGYIEAHGTATKLGDPIEMAGLCKAFESKTDKKRFCGIGSVKSNIGHTDSAAGVASFIKACLSAYNKKIPPSLHYNKPNPHIDFENSPFYVVDELKEWTEQRPLIMGVSSYGIGGTNSHVILEEPPLRETEPASSPEWPELIVLSAKSENSLRRRKADLINFLKTNPGTDLGIVSGTLVSGRSHMQHRSFAVASSVGELTSGEIVFTDGKKDHPLSKIAFMFPGQGAQYVKMGKELYENNKTFRGILDDSFRIVLNETGTDLKSVLFDTLKPEESEIKLAHTELTQPSLFIIEYALSKVLEEIGIRPDYLIGHSIGEYSAACLSGVFDFTSALKIVIRRGQLMSKMPGGSMLAVRAGIEKLKSISDQGFEIAADNGPESCTISFSSDDSAKVKLLLGQNNIHFIELKTSHAFHSAAFDPILAEFRDYVNQFRLNKPSVPFISCLSGTFITAEQAVSGNYWAQQLRNTVQFRHGISKIAEIENVIYLEAGPDTHLGSLARQSKSIANKSHIISTLGKNDGTGELYRIVAAAGNMFNAGFTLDFESLRQGREVRKICLPSYPFDKKRHWIEPFMPDLKDLTAGNDEAAADGSSLSDDLSRTDKLCEGAIKGSVTNKIAGIWKVMMGSNEIGCNDDFFEIGGHSLLALQILTRLKEELGIKLSLKEFLDNPTVNKLAAYTGLETIDHVPELKPEEDLNLSDFPLSYIQKRIWIVSKMDGFNPAYNIPFAYHFSGNLNIDAFRETLNIIFNRHFTVFSQFKERQGEPYCEIVPGAVSIEVHDYSAEPAESSEKKIHTFIGEDSRKQFDLETGPLYRIYLSKQNDSSFYFHGTIHHIIFDGWSFGVLIKDLRRVYDSVVQNKELEIEDVKQYYLDYARGLLNGNKESLNQEAAKFWIENLRGCSPKLNFPFDFPRKETATGFGERESIRFSAESTARLKKLAKEKQATPFASLLSMMGILFKRYSGENDICIGTHVANRPETSLERIFGMFVNTIPVRLQMNDNMSAASLISYTKDLLLDAIVHQEFPFERIVEVVNPERFTNMNPIFQVAVQWINYSAKPIEMFGVRGSRVNIKDVVSPFDISFILWENGDFIEGDIEYNIDILKRDTIVRLKNNLIHLVGDAMENPDKLISKIDLLSDADKALLEEFNNTQREVPSLLVNELFEQQVVLNPDKIAVTAGKDTITYKALEEKSNRLANHLIALGVKGGDVVGICVERSVGMVAGVLGILKAGCCYLPMDPIFPDDRLAYMYEDSGAKVLITQSSLSGKLHHFPDTKVIFIDMESESINLLSAEKPLKRIDNQSLIYMIYTSGSTGKPKGVKVHHEAVVNMLGSMRNTPGMTSNDRLLAVTTLSFDISVLEIFLPLTTGASIIIADTDDIFEGNRLSYLIDKHDLTVMQATPATWNILLGSGWKGKKNLKTFCGGEAILPGLVREILPRVESFWDLYGPTETTVWSTANRLTDANPPILVGKPIDNTRIYILDQANNLVPVGVAGEVCIGGLGVTKGYNNRPELTAEKFISFGDAGTIYKTGDLGRFLPDGSVELFGRIDNQIKLRGFRIEPGEIESLLTHLPSVKEAVVKIQRFEDNDERLVAFLNVGSDFNTTNEQITAYLSRNLPAYMVPSFFQASEGFPKLPNGKINKKALVLELKGEVEHSFESVAHILTPTEMKISAIWSEVLKNKNIAPEVNFFDLGGTSLLAIRILNKIKETFGLTMTFKVFLNNPSIEEAGKYIDSKVQPAEKSLELVHQTQRTNLPLTLNQKRLWMISRLQPDKASYIIPFTYRFTGELNREIFGKSIDILFERHHIIYSVIKDNAGEPYCDIIPAPADIKFTDLTVFSDEEKRRKLNAVFNADSAKVFDLKNGPMYRLYLLRTSGTEYYLRLSIHHIVFDAWSWSVLLKDLNIIYNSLLKGAEPVLEPIEFQQYDYARWEIENDNSAENAELKEFWRENLQGSSPLINFPYDFPRKEQPSGKGQSEAIKLTPEISEKLRAISRKEGSSVFATMLSLFSIEMHKYSGDDDINIGLPVSYRPHSKLENIIGMFVNTVVVRSKYEKGLTFRDFVRRTNDSALNAISHQELSFENVVRIANPGRSSNSNPLFQVSFVWQHFFDTPVSFEGIKSEKAYGEESITPFDITFYFWENGSVIEGLIEYSTDLLRHETVVRLKNNFLNLVEKVSDNADQPVESVSMITKEEEILIDGFNLTATGYPKEKNIIQIFSEQVELFPDKTAVVFRENFLTYRELDEKSNQLAHTLRNSGIRENEPVGIIAEKSIDIITGILGILKAGGGYVPVDPDYPMQRINFIIGDSGCRIVLFQDKFMELDISGIRKISLNSPDTYSNDKSALNIGTRPDDLAYIMYTSGTTGMPKGSMIWHKGVVRLVKNVNYMELSSEDRILLTGAIVFDASTFEIWGMLLNGGTLYIVEKETILNPKALGDELLKNDITILWLTSALFTQIAESRTDIFRKLKYLISGGDVLSAQHINKVRRDNPSLKVINGYGPTENTTFSTTYLIERDFESNIPVGKPVSNSTTYIFDRNMKYQPIGVIGELYVGGDGLSLGYLNRDDLNKKSFIEHPYKPGERLYKTGDYARWLADGNIEFHGRVDNQLKIRGFRVELEEIATVINELEGVVETVIKPVKLQEGDIRLAAFLNVQDDFKLEIKDIAREIKQKLPPYMVPSSFKLMNGFPTTINGKTDRDALKVDVSELALNESREQANFTPNEKIIYDIWSESLKTTDISPTDNFFDVGGNSLMAISVFSKIGSAFNLDLGLRVFFDSPRIKDLAEVIEIELQRYSLSDKEEARNYDDEINIVSGEL